MTDLMVIGILLVVIGGAVFYIVKAKKNGAKCIGCPAAGNCPSKNSSKSAGTCGCQTDAKNKKNP